MIRADEIAARFGLRRASGGRGWAGDCPACGYCDGLRVNEREGRALWWCAICTDKAALAEAVTGKHPAIARQPDHAPADHADRRAAALRLWDAALLIEGTPAHHYLATRGLVLPDGAALRFLPEAGRHPEYRRHLSVVRGWELGPVAREWPVCGLRAWQDCGAARGRPAA